MIFKLCLHLHLKNEREIVSIATWNDVLPVHTSTAKASLHTVCFKQLHN